MSDSPLFDARYELDDRYRLESGRVFLTGTQALTRLPMMQRQRDEAAGLDTRGYISGYRGSPLGTLDLALWNAKTFLEDRGILFEPGINEDLAATAVAGSQQTHLLGDAKHDGVFAMWYGKGPGVDRSVDALKHGNYGGSNANGGVLVLMGDDPGAKSSSIAHQSEQALVHMGMPILNPSNIQDYLDLGLYGFALSRYSGCWVGFKCLTDTVESSASASVDTSRVTVKIPTDYTPPPGGLNIGGPPAPLVEIERRLYEQRLMAAQAFVRANGLDRVVLDAPQRRLGIVTTGKAYLDVRQALDELDIDEARARELGLSLYKVAMSWPLEPVGARAFAEGLSEILVVEEKRPLIEEQLAAVLYNQDARPKLLGKRDLTGEPLVSNVGELTPGDIVAALRRWLIPHASELAPAATISLPVVNVPPPGQGLMRVPSFCSGCPHNTSTMVPEGSRAMGGIGCHGMVAWMPERRTFGATQMGAEGSNWIGTAPFVERPHMFQNMGDGTYFHSGLLAIRASVAAGVNVTYKILVNGAVAMTGGQPIEGESMDGEITTPEIAHQLRSEGVERIAVLSDDIEKYTAGTFPDGVTIHDRDELDRVQRSIRDVEGVSAIVYDQTCAAEARRLRKRGEFPDPDRRIVINELVCEGCGDCSVQSNCISIEPVETELGRKRKINQSSCNKDYSCVKGYCPSFASVYGAKLRQAKVEIADTGGDEVFADLPAPVPADASQPFNILVTGIGGTGVVTVGALLGMAAHLEGKGCLLLDVTGLAQKNGPVSSHVRIADDPDSLHATRIGARSADLLLGCDIVVAAGAEALPKLASGRTTSVVNTHVAPTSAFASSPDIDMSSTSMEARIAEAGGREDSHFVAATRLATSLMGDAIASNLFLMGFALQKGRIPVSLEALERAIELNGRSVAMNKRAVAWGRLAAHDLAAVERAARPGLRDSTLAPTSESLAELIERRAAFLTDYQNAAYAERYRAQVKKVRAAEAALPGDAQPLTDAVSRYYFKVLAYKDEYEVARLWTNGAFRRQLEAEFENTKRLELHLAPQMFFPRDPDTGRVRKLTLGPWMFRALGLLAKLKFLRGTPLDLFGWTRHRTLERQLIGEYETQMDEIVASLTPDNREIAVEIASLPEHVRGFDTVKEEQLEGARAKEVELVDAFHRRASGNTPA